MVNTKRPPGAVCVAALLIGGLFASSTAWAQDTNRARTLFEQGVRAMDSGNPGLASRYFQESYQIYPRASTACNMAQSLERTSRGCDAMNWYRQCAALDREGSFRDHANRQASALSAQCQNTRSPFVGGAQPTSSGQVQVVEQPGYVQQSRPRTVYAVNHTMLAVGIPAFVVGIGAIVGGGFAADEASYQASLLPSDRSVLLEGTPEADTYREAQTFSNLALGLYVGGAIIGGLGLVLILSDLAQPGVFEGSADRGAPRLRLAGLPGGGAQADLQLTF